MKTWQNIVINASVTILVIVGVLKLFPVNFSKSDMKQIQETLNERIMSIQTQLSSIEDVLSARKSSPSPHQTQGPERGEMSPQLSQKLDVIIGRLSLLENKIGEVRSGGTIPVAPNFPITDQSEIPPVPKAVSNPMGWLGALSPEKRREVELIFKDHARRVRERLPAKPDGRFPDRETIRRVMKESDWELKEDLKSVLTDEEYKLFINSHPRPQTSGDIALPDAGPGQ